MRVDSAQLQGSIVYRTMFGDAPDIKTFILTRSQKARRSNQSISSIGKLQIIHGTGQQPKHRVCKIMEDVIDWLM